MHFLSRPPTSDLLWLLGYFLLFWATAAVTWGWSQIGAPWEVTAAGYIAAFFGLLELSLVGVEHALKRIRRVRTQWTRTFRG